METTAPVKISLAARLGETVSSAVGGVVSGIKSTVSRTADAWMATPKAIKLPLETAAILYGNAGEWVGMKGALTGAAILTETPKDLSGFMMNRPAQYFGERWQLFGSSFPADPKIPLTELDNKIGTFERAQPPLINPAQPLKAADHSSESHMGVSPASVANMEKITDKNLEILIEKVSYFSILKTMHMYSGIEESDASTLLSLVDEASRTHKPSLWKIFIGRYGSKMSWFGKVKAGFLYLTLWSWIPILPKTVDAYLTNMLSELRVNLKENGEKRKKFINGLLDDTDNFFEVYNGASETYANDKERSGNLNHYRKNAVDLMMPREEINQGKTPEELRMDLFKKLSTSIVDHFSPKVRFGFLEGWLNNLIKTTLRDRILPEVFLNITEGGQEATKRHNIPFFLALTRTLTEQVSKLQGKLEQDSSDSSSLAGIKNFESIVKKFLWTIDMAECKTVDEVRLKIEQLQEPETGIDADVRSGIQLGIQKGLAVLFDYLSKQENTEELFANLFESVATPLSGNLPMNDKQWAEMATEYEGAKILLKQAGSALCKQIVQEAVQDKVRGGSVPEATEKKAQKIFAEHKARGQETYVELLASCDTIQEKIRQSKDFCSDDTSIHPELASIAAVLKAFENKERVKITTEQDPPPEIAMLPHAEQEAILRVLHPLYEGSNQVMDTVLKLQTDQKQHTVQGRIARELRQIKETVVEIASNHSPEDSLELIERARDHFTNIEEIDPHTGLELRHLKEQILSIQKLLTQVSSEQTALDALSSLQPFPSLDPAAKTTEQTGLIDELLLCIQGNPPAGFKKWKCIEQIKANVKLSSLSLADQNRVLQLVEQMNKYNSLPEPRPDFNTEIWNPLAAILDEQKSKLERNQKRITTLLEKMIPKVHQSASHDETKTEQRSLAIWEVLQERGDLLQTEVTRLHKLIDHAKKEILLHPSAAQLGQIGGTLGFLLGLSTGLVAPEIGAVVGAVSATSVANLGNLAKGKWLKFSIPVIGAGAASGFAARFLAEKAAIAAPNMPLLPALIGAAGASAGLEYVGNKMTKRLIDTGVDIAIPKVTAIFDTAYEHLLTNDIVINAGLKIVMKQMIELFPPEEIRTNLFYHLL